MAEKKQQETSPEKITYFEKQKRIYPQDVKGLFRRFKWYSVAVLLGIYYIVPFLRWDRGSLAPDQAVLIDMPGRRAYFFFIEIWPQEVYYLTGILIFAALMLFAVTSLFGRVWCGYACPQTVWTDLFIKVEHIIQGDRNARIRLDKNKYSFETLWKKALTHVLWIIISLFTGGAFVLYFNDAPTLINQIISLDIPWSIGGWVLGLTASTYIMAGFAKEQVCVYMCPYARFQSAMFDEDTLIIGYDEKRGEKRGKHKKGDTWDNRGDCIDCKQCVNVCPMGIDIREGLQMECIACGLCIDACDNIMEKIDLPKGLIRYDSFRHIQEGTSGEFKRHFMRPRTFWYVGLFVVLMSIIAFGLSHRSPSGIHVMHDRNPLFVMTSDGGIRNGYDINILNKTHDTRKFKLNIIGIDVKEVKFQGYENINIDNIAVPADSVGHYRLFISAEKQTEQSKNIIFEITDTKSKYKSEYGTIFISGKPK